MNSNILLSPLENESSFNLPSSISSPLPSSSLPSSSLPSSQKTSFLGSTSTSSCESDLILFQNTCNTTEFLKNESSIEQEEFNFDEVIKSNESTKFFTINSFQNQSFNFDELLLSTQTDALNIDLSIDKNSDDFSNSSSNNAQSIFLEAFTSIAVENIDPDCDDGIDLSPLSPNAFFINVEATPPLFSSKNLNIAMSSTSDLTKPSPNLLSQNDFFNNTLDFSSDSFSSDSKFNLNMPKLNVILEGDDLVSFNSDTSIVSNKSPHYKKERSLSLDFDNNSSRRVCMINLVFLLLIEAFDPYVECHAIPNRKSSILSTVPIARDSVHIISHKLVQAPPNRIIKRTTNVFEEEMLKKLRKENTLLRSEIDHIKKGELLTLHYQTFVEIFNF